MRALYYETYGGEINITNVPDPTPQSHGVVLKVTATGLCRSDWHGWMGHDADITLPHVPGHELAGEIVGLGKKIQKFKIGDRVTVPFVGGCGHCEYCSKGDHQVCPNQFQPGFTHWGSFAEYVGIHYADTNLVKLPEDIDDVTAACLGCRFATSYRALVDQAHIESGKTLAVFGCGGVGLSSIMIAKSFGLKVVAIDIDKSKLQLAKKHGADIVYNSLNDDHLIESLVELTKGGVDYTLDAIGDNRVIANAMMILKRRGKHIQVGLLPPEQKKPFVPIDRMIAYELEIKGSHGMQAHRYHEMIKLIQDGKLDPKAFVTNYLSLEESAKALFEMGDFKIDGVQIITNI